MNEKWIVFYNVRTGKRLAAVTLEGTFEDEIQSTKGLLSFENNIEESDIQVKIE